jgi:hypothetical protein
MTGLEIDVMQDRSGKMRTGIKDAKKLQEENEKRRQVRYVGGYNDLLMTHRLMKNRQSAALSRQRKKEFISNLQKQVQVSTQNQQSLQLQVTKLTTQNWESKLAVERLEKEILKLISENNELKSKLKELGVPIDDKPKNPADLGVGSPVIQQIAAELAASSHMQSEEDVGYTLPPAHELIQAVQEERHE